MNEVMHAAGRGAVAAMAMTGMRAFTVNLGIVEQPPPQAIFKQKARGLLALVPRKKRRAAIELVHWSYGAGGGLALRSCCRTSFAGSRGQGRSTAW